MTIFELFACRNDHVAEFKKPFYLNGKTISVGLHRMVWADDQVEGVKSVELDAERASGIQGLIDSLNPDAVFERVDVELPEHKKCLHCDSGRVPVECPECLGSGEIKTHTDFNLYTNACRTCLGTGKPIDNRHGECLKCDATGITILNKESDLPTLVKVKGVFVDARLLADFYSSDTVFYVNPDKPDTLYFKDYDCTGLVKAVA